MMHHVFWGRVVRGAVVLCLFALSCAKKESSPPTTTGPTNPPVGVVDDSAGFYARVVQVANLNFPIHAGDTTMGAACLATQGQQIDCYVEGEELDVYFNGLTLQMNVPTSLCAYTYFMPYYYYAWHPGTGPTSVQVDTDMNGAVGIDTNNDGTVDGPAVTVCPYDYTAQKGPNCCVGTYTTVNRIWNSTATPAGYAVTATPNNAWGGNWSTCLSGPAVTSQPKNVNGFPEPTLSYTYGTGTNFTYPIASPISLQKGSNVYVANYFNPVQTGGPPPTAVVKPYYDIQCLDRSYELQAQIRVQVREWNTEADFNNRVAVPTGFDTSGFEPTPFGAFPLNDFKDWGDFLNTYPQGTD